MFNNLFHKCNKVFGSSYIPRHTLSHDIITKDVACQSRSTVNWDQGIIVIGVIPSSSGSAIVIVKQSLLNQTLYQIAILGLQSCRVCGLDSIYLPS
jgi:hypothetical protein